MAVRTMRFDYEYYADGRLKQLVDLDDQVGQPSQVTFHYMSRQYSYDHVGRTKVVQALPAIFRRRSLAATVMTRLTGIVRLTG
jgi:hypothetical protein